MKFEKIPEFLSYRNFVIEAQADGHTVCRVSFVILSEKAEAFLHLAQSRQMTTIVSDNGNKLMSGFVSEVTINYGMSVAMADTVIVSRSLEHQENSRERIFQNPQKTYADILKSFPYVVKGNCQHMNDKIESVICQHNTDDFSFLTYLAHMCGERLWINDDGEILFGRSGNDAVACT